MLTNEMDENRIMDSVREELDSILMGSCPVSALKQLRESGAMHAMFPELEELYNLTQNKYHSGTAWEHTL